MNLSETITTEQECLAMIWAVGKFRVYLIGVDFKIVTYHCALCYIFKKEKTTQKLIRWALTLQEYDFEVIHMNGIAHKDAVTS